MSELIDTLLAQGAAPSPGGKKAYSVEQYNRAVHNKMKTFPRTWVKGVLTQVDVRGKAVYMTLADFAEGDARPRAVLPVMMWAREFDAYAARFAQLPTPFQIRAELKVSFLVESDFYVQGGRFQPKVADIDESFTLGELAQTRLKILAALRREGLLEANKRRPLSPVPLRVGLVSARGSAAYQDFTTVLMQSGFSFDILFAEARMQGQDTEATVVAAIQRLAGLPEARRPEVICVVRGGGSRTDLVYFDSEAICRAIAASPVPVLTGIGHEIDRSLADMVAYEDLLTPTDCAKFLENRVGEAWTGLAERAAGLRESWEDAYHAQGRAAVQRARLLGAAWEARARREGQRQREAARGLIHATARFTKSCKDKLALNRTGLRRGPEKILRLESVGLDLKAKLLQASDPVALLKRGFAQVVTASGRWMRGVADAAPGDLLRVRFADGAVSTRVEGVEPAEPVEPAPLTSSSASASAADSAPHRKAQGT